MRPIFIAAALAAAAPAAGQPQPQPVTFIHAGQLLDRPGRPPSGPSTLVVRAGRIERVEEGHSAPPAGATLVDLTDRFVLPGLIDSHVHLESDAGGNAGLVEDVTLNDAQWAFQAMENGRKTIEAGFTTVRNLGGGPAGGALRDAIARGAVVGPRILDAGSGWRKTSTPPFPTTMSATASNRAAGRCAPRSAAAPTSSRR